MTTIAIRLDDERLARFRGAAELLGVPTEEVARESIERWLDRRDEDFERVIDEILAERGEVLRRLAR